MSGSDPELSSGPAPGTDASSGNRTRAAGGDYEGNSSGGLPFRYVRSSESEVDEVAGWSEDPSNGTAVWLPSWFRDGTYSLEVEAPTRDGRAHGRGRMVLTASEPGDSDRTFEGNFAEGHFHGSDVEPGEFHFLETDSFLYRLPESPVGRFHGIDFWIRTEFGVRIAVDPCYVRTNGRPDLIAIVPPGFPEEDEQLVADTMKEAWRLFQERCADGRYADVFVVPSNVSYEKQRSARIPEYSPLIAKAGFYGFIGQEPSISP